MNKLDQSKGISRRKWLKFSGIGGTALLAAGRASAEQAPAKRVKGVVFMVSDGMSPGVLTLAESYSKLTRNRGTHWWKLLDDPAAARGLMDTASASSMVTDSAAASSAWGGGQRTNNGVINVSPDGVGITPIAALLKKASGARIGLVSTATVTHATPAGFAASMQARNDEDDIAPQYLDRVDVILGGGRRFFDPKMRPDKRDLQGEFSKAGYEVVANRDALLSARGKRLLGTFSKGHVPYRIDRDHNPALAARTPSLKEMSEAALSRFLADDKPFLLQIEGARIDHAAHLNDAAGLIGEQMAFDDSLAAVLAMIANRDDILVVVTSDHGNANPGLRGMGAAYVDSTRCFDRLRGMKASHEWIIAEWKRSKQRDVRCLAELIEGSLGFSLGIDEAEALHASFSKQDVTEWNHQLENPQGLLGQFAGNHTGIGWNGTTHTSDPTLVSAIGPQAERFSGMVRNTDVFRHLMELLA